MLRLLDLFAGIGGLTLGLQRSGYFEPVAFCDSDPFCRLVLAKHWPGVPIYDDVQTLDAGRLAADGITVDAICGGFPCQDVSRAGKRAGIEGERSGLWVEFARLIGELRPRYVVVENVAGLLNRGLDRVLGDLATLGFDAEWHCIPASAIGARHVRDRIWIVGYPQRIGRRSRRNDNAEDDRRFAGPDGQYAGALADPDRERELQSPGRVGDIRDRPRFGGPDVSDADLPRLEIFKPGLAAQFATALGSVSWSFEPGVGRVAARIPGRVDRIRSLGNSAVPQIPEVIGRLIGLSEEP